MNTTGRDHRPYFEELYRAHGEPWDYSGRAAEMLRLEYVADLVRRLAPRSVLEVGCSLGLLTVRLARVSPQLVALDVVPAAVLGTRARLEQELARRPGTLPPLLAASALLPPFRAGSFDLVLCTDGLRSWQLDAEQRAAALREIHRLLVPGGRVILTEHMRPQQFPDFVRDVEESPLRVASVDYLGDRLWYQFESWFKPIRRTPFARTVLGNLAIGRALRLLARRLGPTGSRHLCVVASRDS